MSDTNYARNFSRILVIIFGIVIMAVGIIVLFLYVIPGFSFFGMEGVYINNQYTTYTGAEIEAIFNERNVIVESSNTEVIFRIRKTDYGDQAKITVFENANGIAFNSKDRTHLSFLHYLDGEGVPYTKIIVHEPKGAVSRTARIYLNLKFTGNQAEDLLPYNIILNTGKSSVRFEYDSSVAEMRIGSFVLNGSGNVTMPAVVSGFDLEVGNIDINSSSGAWLRCLYPVTEDVNINGNSRNVTFGEIGGDLNISGSKNSVYAQKINGNTYFDSNGSINITNECGGILKVDSQQVNINVQKADRVMINAKTGTVSVNRIETTSEIVMDGGVLNLGAATPGQGAVGNVFINKKQGATNVTFASFATGCCHIDQVDGEIKVNGACGQVLIEVPARGNANVYVSFRAVVLGSEIKIHGSREPNRFGSITVVLLDLGQAMRLRVWGTMTAWNYIKNESISNTQDPDTGVDILPAYQVNGSGGNSILVRTMQKVEVRSA